MNRFDMIGILGNEYLVTNIENGEYSYPKAFKEKGLKFLGEATGSNQHQYLDLRFTNGDLSILIETKQDFTKDLESAKKQLATYVKYEMELTGNKIIAILANTTNDLVKVWKGVVSEEGYLEEEYKLKTFDEYAEYYTKKTNDKETVMKNTYELNEMLHEYGIRERLRSQFVGTCLLTLKNSKANLTSKDMNTDMIRGEMKGILGALLQGDVNRASKVSLLDRNVLDSQDIRTLDDNYFRIILVFIKEKILPFINDKSTAGQDLLNLFFVTFNKYVGKEDKNQAFTPDHITEFMSDVVEVNRHSKILDPCCGSGSFLVRSMTHALADCATEEEQIDVKENNIYGIEFDENIYGLATTNMLIHGDGNSNIRLGSLFDLEDEIEKWGINTVLMNPPYNATRSGMPLEYTRTWNAKTKQDPSKGLYFVKRAIDSVKTGRMAVLLPMSCAIGSSREIRNIKEEILRENTLDAVFSLPDQIFYPGASAVVCCMVFTLGKRHDEKKPTFFGYYKEDGFVKKRNLGRVERIHNDGLGLWVETKEKWLDLYFNKKAIPGISALSCVSGKDEWLAEAYMETDYTQLEDKDFEETIRKYYSYLVRKGSV